MKKAVFCALALITLAGIPIGLFSLELGMDFRIGNLAFDADRAITATDFDGLDFSSWGLSFFVNHRIGDDMSLSSGFYSDQILRNVSYTHITYRENIFSIGAGPFFGYFNSNANSFIKPGISAFMRIEIPYIVFIDFRADNSLNVRLTLDQDYIQERTELSAGFFVPNAECVIGYSSRKFTQLKILDDSGTDVPWDYIDSLAEYYFRTVIFRKNVPYRLSITFAWQTLSKSYLNQDTSDLSVHQLNSIILGTGIVINFTPAIQYVLDARHSVYTFGSEELTGVDNPGPLGYSFRAFTGIRVNVDTLFQSTEIEEF